MGVSENRGIPYFGVLMIRILLFRVLYWGPLFSETPIRILILDLDAYVQVSAAATVQTQGVSAIRIFVCRLCRFLVQTAWYTLWLTMGPNLHRISWKSRLPKRARLIANSSSIGASIIPDTILGSPCYNYSIMSTKTLIC